MNITCKIVLQKTHLTRYLHFSLFLFFLKYWRWNLHLYESWDLWSSLEVFNMASWCNQETMKIIQMIQILAKLYYTKLLKNKLGIQSKNDDRNIQQKPFMIIYYHYYYVALCICRQHHRSACISIRQAWNTLYNDFTIAMASIEIFSLS